MSHTISDVKCPKLKILRVKGCPYLVKLRLEITDLSELDLSQSMPLLALRSLQVITHSAKHLASNLAKVPFKYVSI